ncbi:MAG: hypothetical protein R3C09_07470 [Pirellulaceae bacterium]
MMCLLARKVARRSPAEWKKVARRSPAESTCIAAIELNRHLCLANSLPMTSIR